MAISTTHAITGQFRAYGLDLFPDEKVRV